MVGIAVNQNEAKIIDEVAALLKKAGYVPYDQIYGYVHTGEDFYITRQGGARDIQACRFRCTERVPAKRRNAE